MTLPVRSPSRSPAPRDTSSWDPFRELEDLYERVNRLWAESLGTVDRWAPLADVEETEDAYSVEIELPGVSRDDVDIQLGDRQLTVTGEVRQKERTGILRRTTRRVGRFSYAVTLPGDVDADGVTASLADGVLTVHVPKAEQARPRRIAITG
ncbi:Hsp20/alpha crystallin family protein [Geodermatophilus maliterrae]|uniref:Hsp20/alpha crystallin family protein n=1 Tax=Geodermatophilus maliterrae TaxID=3162531 RepID=A0ABV3XE85_9ACTN